MTKKGNDGNSNSDEQRRQDERTSQDAERNRKSGESGGKKGS
jgi:hypothetical protein